MDRGIPTEEVLAEMRAADPPVFYLVGTPKGRLSKLEKALLGLPWQAVAKASRSSCWRILRQALRRTSFTCWRRAAPASTRNAPSGSASSDGCGRAPQTDRGD
jgi:hypothetical protein